MQPKVSCSLISYITTDVKHSQTTVEIEDVDRDNDRPTWIDPGTLE